jgi:hypothetical protein
LLHSARLDSTKGSSRPRSASILYLGLLGSGCKKGTDRVPQHEKISVHEVRLEAPRRIIAREHFSRSRPPLTQSTRWQGS